MNGLKFIDDIMNDEDYDPTRIDPLLRDQYTKSVVSLIDTIMKSYVDEFFERLTSLFDWLNSKYKDDSGIAKAQASLKDYIVLNGRPQVLEAWYTDMKPYLFDCSQQTLSLLDFESKIAILKLIGFTDKVKPILDAEKAGSKKDSDTIRILWKYIHRLNIKATEYHRWSKDTLIKDVFKNFGAGNMNFGELVASMTKTALDPVTINRTADHLVEIQNFDGANEDVAGVSPKVMKDVAQLATMYKHFTQGLFRPNSDDIKKGPVYYDTDSDCEDGPKKPVVKKASELRAREY
jgi:hypothetical protein